MRILLKYMEDVYSGDPEKIVEDMRHGDHGGAASVEDYVRRVSTSLGLKVDGSTRKEICERFIDELIDNGWAERR